MGIVFNEKNLLKKNDLISGKFYIWKDGNVRMFLGYVNDGELAFYHICCLSLRERQNHLVPVHEEIQIPYIAQICDCVIKKGINSEYIYTYQSIPKILGTIGATMNEENVYQWLTKNALLGNHNYNIVTTNRLSVNKNEANKNFVSAKDLVPGRLYYGGSCAWRNTYVYLGREIWENNFVWCFIGNDEAYKSNPYNYIKLYGSHDIERTKSNKKVRLLTPDQNSELAGIEIDVSKLSLYFLK